VAGGVEHDAPLAAGLAELRGHQVGPAAGDDLGEPHRGAPELFCGDVSHDRNDEMEPLAAGGLHERAQAEIVQHLEHQEGRLDRGLERTLRRIDVDDEQVGSLEPVPANGRRVELEAAWFPSQPSVAASLHTVYATSRLALGAGIVTVRIHVGAYVGVAFWK
jgi:hypothetical protein